MGWRNGLHPWRGSGKVTFIKQRVRVTAAVIFGIYNLPFNIKTNKKLYQPQTGESRGKGNIKKLRQTEQSGDT